MISLKLSRSESRSFIVLLSDIKLSIARKTVYDSPFLHTAFVASTMTH